MTSTASSSSFSDALPTQAEPILSALADIAMLLDKDGVITWAHQSSYEIAELDTSQWIGQTLDQVITIECHDKGRALISEALSHSSGRPRQLNHQMVASTGMPKGSIAFDYRSMKVGDDGQTLLIGRDMKQTAALQERLIRAQQALEHDYDRYRQTESRYRQIFHLAAHALLVVDAGDLSIVDANKAARAILAPLGDINGSGLVGKIFPKDFAGLIEADNDKAITGLLRSAVSGRVASRKAISLGDKGDSLKISFEGRDQGGNLIVRVGSEAPDTAVANRSDPTLVNVLDHMPEALVITDETGQIITANQSFFEMTELSSIEALQNASIGRWLNFGGMSFSSISKSATVSNGLRMIPGEMVGEFGSARPVEVSLTQVRRDTGKVIGLLLRDTSTRTAPETRSLLPGDSTFDNAAELIGQMSLKDIVRETTDVIERMCIETALAMTHGNRASAAELLGLSRQSLYIKMRRFGIEKSREGQ